MIQEYHKILNELTVGQYPISSDRAFFNLMIPFYNYYWNFKWTKTMSEFIRNYTQKEVFSGSFLGVAFLLSKIFGLYLFTPVVNCILLKIVGNSMVNLLQPCLDPSAEVE